MTDQDSRQQKLNELRKRRGTRVAPVPHAGQSGDGGGQGDGLFGGGTGQEGNGKLRAALKARMQGGGSQGGGNAGGGQGGEGLKKLLKQGGDKAQLRQAIVEKIRAKRQGGGGQGREGLKKLLQERGSQGGAGQGRAGLKKLLQERKEQAGDGSNQSPGPFLKKLIELKRAQGGNADGGDATAVAKPAEALPSTSVANPRATGSRAKAKAAGKYAKRKK